MKKSTKIELLYEHYKTHKSISIDSRNILPGAIFFAIRGKRFNANIFAKQAIENGASYAVIDDENCIFKDDKCIFVKDALLTLQQLAAYHRLELKMPIIAITGSNGKTTTKELVKAILSCKYKTASTISNYNTRITLPITVLNIEKDAQIAVLEMGASELRNIETLCDIAMPTHGLVTNMHAAHIEGFGSFSNVIKGKSELYSYLDKHNGTVFVNSTDSTLLNASKFCKNIIYYPQCGVNYYCKFLKEDPFVTYASKSGQEVTTQLIGKHQFINISAALCIGNYFQVDEAMANDAIKNFKPGPNRSELIHKGSCTILLDAYNANLESMKCAIHALAMMPHPRKMFILGEMKELGELSKEAHIELVRFALQYNNASVLLCGKDMMMAAKEIIGELSYEYPLRLVFPSKDLLENYLNVNCFNQTAILLKGSRSMQMDSLVECIIVK